MQGLLKGTGCNICIYIYRSNQVFVWRLNFRLGSRALLRANKFMCGSMNMSNIMTIWTSGRSSGRGFDKDAHRGATSSWPAAFMPTRMCMYMYVYIYIYVYTYCHIHICMHTGFYKYSMYRQTLFQDPRIITSPKCSSLGPGPCHDLRRSEHQVKQHCELQVNCTVGN